jgi:hypothetical protein
VVNSTSEIHHALFNDEISVKTQYNKCSIGKLTWVSRGVHEIYLPKPIDSYKSALEARNAAYKAIQKSSTYKQRFGSENVRDVPTTSSFVFLPVIIQDRKLPFARMRETSARLREKALRLVEPHETSVITGSPRDS